MSPELRTKDVSKDTGLAIVQTGEERISSLD